MFWQSEEGTAFWQKRRRNSAGLKYAERQNFAGANKNNHITWNKIAASFSAGSGLENNKR